jgi:hypothetical protein
MSIEIPANLARTVYNCSDWPVQHIGFVDQTAAIGNMTSMLREYEIIVLMSETA